MDAILRQIGELLISSIPTIISLLIVWTSYYFLVHKKLHQVLEQRHALTQGAIERAQQEIARAEARTAEYEQKVREARAEIYKTQQSGRQQIMDARTAALAEARKQAGDKVKEARASVAATVTTSKAALREQADALADKVIESVLKPATAGGR
ncbi:MAG TPA: ATP synthase F0 subunit B [Candidatus Angelobacter sp.]|jgi:F-type H+-transporting ATPase subunit b